MKIAIFTNNYAPFIGGVPISIERLAKGLRRIGHQVTIFAPDYEGHMDNKQDLVEKDIVRYKSLKRTIGDGMIIGNCLDPIIEKEFRKGDFDVIHVHHPFLIGYTAIYLGHKYKVPVVYTYHTRYEEYLHHIKSYSRLVNKYEGENHRLLKTAEEKLIHLGKDKFVPFHNRVFMNHCDRVIVPTNNMKEILASQQIKSKMNILPTGLDEEAYRNNDEESNKIREQYIGNKKYLLCSVARLEKEKNIEFIIKGISELKKRLGSTFRLLLIGDGTEREKLEEMVWELDLEDEISFLGMLQQDEITNYYRACNAFVFASKSETQGIVLLEAMAASLPVVAIKASGVEDVVCNGENGFMTEESVNEWAEKINLILTNQQLGERLRCRASITARDYSMVQIANQAAAYYNDIINNKEVTSEVGKKIKGITRAKSRNSILYLSRTNSQNMHY